MRFASLPEWLTWQETLHFTEVDPGLERVAQVWQQLNGSTELPFKVVTVAGTNGKGSSVAILDSILRSASYKTGCYTSPHLLKYNERITVDGSMCDDEQICGVFEQIDRARGDVSLTYFEFATLAAIVIFCQQKIDIAILEVGMGGRLDAVNLFDADIALITPIALDHTQWLGDDIETIAYEKAGIIRQNKPVVCSESDPPAAIINRADSLNAQLFKAENNFKTVIGEQSWQWSSHQADFTELPWPNLAGSYQIQNASAVLQVVILLGEHGFTIEKTDIVDGLLTVELPGRFQQLSGKIERIFDVTHNQQGAENLAQLLAETKCAGRTIAVLAMLKDKDVSSVVKPLSKRIDNWYLASLTGSRGMTSSHLAEQFYQHIDEAKLSQYDTVQQAYKQAMADAKEGDRVLIFGSFYTVEAVMLALN